MEIRDALQGAGIEVHLSSDVTRELWNKLIFICALSGMTCITRSSMAEVVDTPATLDLARRVMQETAEVGRAQGVSLDDDIVESTMALCERLKHQFTSSMFLDLEAGNPLEISVLNGAVTRIGREAGVDTPVNDVITACLSIADDRARTRLSPASSA